MKAPHVAVILPPSASRQSRLQFARISCADHPLQHVQDFQTGLTRLTGFFHLQCAATLNTKAAKEEARQMFIAFWRSSVQVPQWLRSVAGGSGAGRPKFLNDVGHGNF